MCRFIVFSEVSMSSKVVMDPLYYPAIIFHDSLGLDGRWPKMGTRSSRECWGTPLPTTPACLSVRWGLYDIARARNQNSEPYLIFGSVWVFELPPSVRQWSGWEMIGVSQSRGARQVALSLSILSEYITFSTSHFSIPVPPTHTDQPLVFRSIYVDSDSITTQESGFPYYFWFPTSNTYTGTVGDNRNKKMPPDNTEAASKVYVFLHHFIYW